MHNSLFISISRSTSCFIVAATMWAGVARVAALCTIANPLVTLRLFTTPFTGFNGWGWRWGFNR